MANLSFDPSPAAASPTPGAPWWKELNRYHWFVLIVAALGWLFDCLDQQLFNISRRPAMSALLEPGQNVDEYAGYATAIFLVGWACGGLIFGVLGDRIGRAKTMMITILIYSLCTGLSALSQGFWDFAFYRFITGLGVGGEFAVGVALVAEVMPHRARPYALGLLQALSAVGNISAAGISMAFGELETAQIISPGQAWRWMFVVGAVPALLALVIRSKLREPEQWRAAKAAASAHQKQLGSYAELFGNPRWQFPAYVAGAMVLAIFAVSFGPKAWPKLQIALGLAALAILAGLWSMFGGGRQQKPWRRHALVGLLLACSGVIGLWGIGFFSIDLTRSVQKKQFESLARQAGEAELDRAFLREVLKNPSAFQSLQKKLKATDLLSPEAGPNLPRALFEAAEVSWKSESGLESPLSTPKLLDPKLQGAAEAYLAQGSTASGSLQELNDSILKRSAGINGKLTFWSGVTSMMLNIGAFVGMIAFSIITQRIGRRPAFAIAFIAAMLSTAAVFWYLKDFRDIFWMLPIMGCCQLALFGGYAIYFPELFPTHLRSTGTSFCYNVGRFVAASGPAVLGLLTSQVFHDKPEPMRYAGLTMCGIFLLGLAVLPFAPETKGKPLPE